MKLGALLLMVVALLAAPQQTSQSNQDKSKSTDDKTNLPPPPPAKNEPAPLFGGQIGTKSSQKGKESASLGFNGIDPSGKVQQSVLSASPSATSVAQVRNMDATRPTPVELAAFIREGGLKSR
ncbi:MAG TPA: hypothetical protein VGV35_00190 [Bryobacteraceae bacterium]|nr:hypothetical protein [Bryobacteraceae bacterium]